MIKLHTRYEPYPHYYTTEQGFTPEMQQCIRSCLKYEAEKHGRILLAKVDEVGWTTIHSTPKPQRDRFYVTDPSVLQHTPEWYEHPGGKEFRGYRIVAQGYHFNVTFGETGRVLPFDYEKRRKRGGFNFQRMSFASGAMAMSESTFDLLTFDSVFAEGWDNFEPAPSIKLWKCIIDDFQHAIQLIWPKRWEIEPFALAREALSLEEECIPVDGLARPLVPRRHLLRALPFIFKDTEYNEVLRDYVDTYFPLLAADYPTPRENGQ